MKKLNITQKNDNIMFFSKILSVNQDSSLKIGRFWGDRPKKKLKLIGNTSFFNYQ